jgi:hypothetical protein
MGRVTVDESEVSSCTGTVSPMRYAALEEEVLVSKTV